MPTPTQSAQNWFQLAKADFFQAVSRADVSGPELRLGLGGLNMANGLMDLATGLRATYMLLEEVKQMLQRQPFPR